MNPWQGCPKWNNLPWGLRPSDPSPGPHTTPAPHVSWSLLHPFLWKSQSCKSCDISAQRERLYFIYPGLGQNMDPFLVTGDILDPHIALTQEVTSISSRMVPEKPIYLTGSSVSLLQSRWFSPPLPKPADSPVCWHDLSQTIKAWIAQLLTGR